MTNIVGTGRAMKPGVAKKASSTQSRLAEAILLQALEDLWLDGEKANCIAFFSGEEFHTCSKIAGMSSNDKVKILNLVIDIIYQNSGKDNKVRDIKGDREMRVTCAMK